MITELLLVLQPRLMLALPDFGRHLRSDRAETKTLPWEGCGTRPRTGTRALWHDEKQAPDYQPSTQSAVRSAPTEPTEASAPGRARHTASVRAPRTSFLSPLAASRPIATHPDTQTASADASKRYNKRAATPARWIPRPTG